MSRKKVRKLRRKLEERTVMWKNATASIRSLHSELLHLRIERNANIRRQAQITTLLDDGQGISLVRIAKGSYRLSTFCRRKEFRADTLGDTFAALCESLPEDDHDSQE